MYHTCTACWLAFVVAAAAVSGDVVFEPGAQLWGLEGPALSGTQFSCFLADNGAGGEAGEGLCFSG